MAEATLETPPSRNWENRSLFSDHFLAERIATHPRWEGDLSVIVGGRTRALIRLFKRSR